MSIIYGKGIYIMGEPPVPEASLTSKSGVTYTDGLPNNWNIIKEIAKPAYTAADNGKVLGVVEGKLA